VAGARKRKGVKNPDSNFQTITKLVEKPRHFVLDSSMLKILVSLETSPFGRTEESPSP
jgi:hypothetical protein